MPKWRGSKKPDGSYDKPYFYHPENFTQREIERLGAVAVQANIEFQEMNREAINRLLFARYLVGMEIIGEGIEGNGVDFVEGYTPDIIIGGEE